MEEEVPTCPLCLEDLDATDRAMQPCKCSYVVCCWCLNHIREQLNGLCPACRTPYEEQNFTFKEVSTEAALKEAKERANAKKERERRERLEELERERARAQAVSQQKAKANLKHARFIQRNLVYVNGLSLTLAREECLRRQDMFGRFGRLVRVLVNKAQPYNADAPGGPSISAYVQFARDIDASAAARGMNNVVFDGREIHCAIASTKYCDTFVRSSIHCGNSDCLYVHEISSGEDILTREEVLARQLGPPPPSYLFLPLRRRDGVAPGSKAPNPAAGMTSKGCHEAPIHPLLSGLPTSTSGHCLQAEVPGHVASGLARPSSRIANQLQGRANVSSTRGIVGSSMTSCANSATLSTNSLRSPSQNITALSGTHGFQPRSLSSDVEQMLKHADPVTMVPNSPVFGGGVSGGMMGPSRMSAPQLPSYSNWSVTTSSRRSPPGSPNVRPNSSPNSPPIDNGKRSRKRQPAISRNKIASVPRTNLDNLSRAAASRTEAQNAPPGFEESLIATTGTKQVRPPGFSVPVGGSRGTQGVDIDRHNGNDDVYSSSLTRSAGHIRKAIGNYETPPGFEQPASTSSSIFPGAAPNLELAGNLSTGASWGWRKSDTSNSGAVGHFDVLSNESVEISSALEPKLTFAEVQLNSGTGLTDSAQSKVGISVATNAEVAFAGRGIALPPISIESSYNAPTLRPSAQFPLQALGELNGIPASESVLNFHNSSLKSNIDADGVSVAPVLRPSRRNNSRFGFARNEESPLTLSSKDISKQSHSHVQEFSVVDSEESSLHEQGCVSIDERQQSEFEISSGNAVNMSSTKPSRSRFDFAEHEKDLISSDLNQSMQKTLAQNTASSDASDVSSASLNFGMTPFAFSQLSTEDKLASLFQSAQLSSNALPPMPSMTTKQPFERLSISEVKVPLVEPPSTVSTALPRAAPLVPPGFVGVPAVATDNSLVSDTPGIARSTIVSEERFAPTASKGVTTETSTLADESDAHDRPIQSTADVCQSRETAVENDALQAQDIGAGAGVQEGSVTVVEKLCSSSKLGGDEGSSTDRLPCYNSLEQHAYDTELMNSEVELERQVQAARAREAQLTAQLSDLQQQIRHFDNIRT